MNIRSDERPNNIEPDELAVTVGKNFIGFLKSLDNINEILDLRRNHRETIFVDFQLLKRFDRITSNNIRIEYSRFYPYLCRAARSFTIDLIHGEQEEIEKLEVKNISIGFYNVKDLRKLPKLISADCHNILTSCQGIVVRVSEVKMLLVIGCFKCKLCSTEQIVDQNFMLRTPSICRTSNCGNRTEERFELIPDKSYFVDYQHVLIQEHQKDLLPGAIPTNMQILITGTENFDNVFPGDNCEFVGTVLCLPFRSFTRSTIETTGLSFSYSYWANTILRNGKLLKSEVTSVDHPSMIGQPNLIPNRISKIQCSPENRDLLKKINENKNSLYDLAVAFFPTIVGYDHIKISLLLQMLSGVSKSNSGIDLRGNMNICLVGDPSSGKSEFLSAINKNAPLKTIYISGQGSTVAGLTASCIIDNHSNCLQPGALVLADEGILCIDELDKLQIEQLNALHEAMEQQTVSIAKAGITTTLKARSTILAAANPIQTVYNHSLSAMRNIGLSPALISRFDLVLLLVNPDNREVDKMIARKIVDNRIKKPNPQFKYSIEEVQIFIEAARQIKPKLNQNSITKIVEEYVGLRDICRTRMVAWRITIRHLQGLIRLSEAIAKANISEYVEPYHIKTAAKLIEQSCTGSTAFSETDEPPIEEDDNGVPEELYIQLAQTFLERVKRSENDGIVIDQKDLINWYIDTRMITIVSNNLLVKELENCARVLDRLIAVKYLILVGGELKLGPLAPDAISAENFSSNN